MKSKDNIDELFDRLEEQWNALEPHPGHQHRFLEKLDAQGMANVKNSKLHYWKFFSIAASLALLITIGVQFYQQSSSEKQETVETPQLTVKKPMEVERTEFYFTALINKEIEKINEISGPQTKQMVVDLQQQLTRLENDYKKLELDLKNQGDVKQILNAMIINFQTRINLSQDVLDKIKKVEQLKNTEHEKYTI